MNSPLPNFLYEPNASLMKAGDYAQITDRYDIAAIGINSHLLLQIIGNVISQADNSKS